MTELVWPFLGGMGLGLLFFGGLWWTIRWVLVKGRSALWMAVSLLLRCAAVGLGFYWLTAGRGLPLLAALAGFLLVRGVLLALSRKNLNPTGTLPRGEGES